MLSAFTLFHVVISLAGIGAGFVFALDLLSSRLRPSWTKIFLISTIATSVTGFLFPVDRILPSHIIGGISLAVLAVTLVARRNFQADGSWRKTFILTALLAQYFNVFVLVVQMFRRIPQLKALAPTQSEPPFAAAQGLVLFVFVCLAWLAVKRFHPASQSAPLRMGTAA